MKQFYENISEARRAITKMGITSSSDYKSRYKEDSRLPANPEKVYATEWRSWSNFLSMDKLSRYSTLREASEAAVRLGVKTYIEYKSRFKEDSRLRSSPDTIYSNEWVSWYDFLGKKKPRWYTTIDEASDAAKSLGITTYAEYKARRKEDPHLPLHPHITYKGDWQSWYLFLGKEKRYLYPTLREASDAAKSLGITTVAEYKERYKKDPRLPINLYEVYKGEWVDWYQFLGKEKPSCYPTLREASDAARSLGINTNLEYKSRYKEDFRLPANPHAVYAAQWQNWYSFLGKKRPSWYPTLREASKAAVKLGITSSSEYKARHSEDPALPAYPHSFYRSEWVDMYHFLGRKKTFWYPTLREASDATISSGIKSSKEYKARYKEDPRLPAHPEDVYALEWIDWFHFTGKKKSTRYPSLREASEAAQSLGITSGVEYIARYKEDPHLPLNLNRTYADEWVDWFHFLGKEKPSRYPTWREASEAAKSLGITSSSEYASRYKEDSNLPADPQRFYSNEWQSWHHFLDKPKTSWYPTLSEASDAAVYLGITSSSEYQLRYKVDPRLPLRPPIVYEDMWNGWADFLIPKTVSNLQQFRLACALLNIKNSVQYRKKRLKYPQLPSKPEAKITDWSDWYDALDIPRPYSYDELVALVRSNGISTLAEYTKFRVDSKDPRIPSKPEECYRGRGWTNTYNFFGTPPPYQVKYFTEVWFLWRDKIQEFLKSARGGDTKAKDLCEFVREYIEPNGLETCPLEFLTRGSTNIQPMLDLLEQAPTTRKKKWIFSINEFLDWVISNYLTIEDIDTGEITLIKGAENPFGHINFNGEVNNQVASETNKLALPYQNVKAGREWIFPLNSVEHSKSYCNLTHLHNFPSDWLQIDDDSLLDKNDPDCVFKVIEGKTYLWLPIYWTYTYSLMQLPARGMQIIYCDSGEADQEIADFDCGNVIWVKNKTSLAGLTNNQGMVNKSGKDDFGVHYTSNKTKFDGSGYTIPFMPIELAYWLIKLRKWQQKYNPIKEPTQWLQCTRTYLNEVQRKQKGSNCFLFRDYLEQEPGNFGGRLSTRLAAALFFSSKKDVATATFRGMKYSEAITELEKASTVALSRFKSPYTPHSMRVSLINAYAYEFGIPLEVIMKLVGHSSIIMTIYYTKSDKTGANLREKMEIGEKEALSKASKTIKSFLEQQRIEEIKSQLVGSSTELLNSLNNSRPGASYLFKDFGICPVGGAFCSEGGMPVATKANIYHPVSAGYLGEQNCIQCRFFITGPAFLVGLAAIFNEISLAVNTQTYRYSELEKELDKVVEKIDVIDHQLYKLKTGGLERHAMEVDRRELIGERVHLNSTIETRAKKLDLYMSDMNAIHRHIHNCQELIVSPKENSNDSLQLIVPREFRVGFELEDVSYFHQLSEVCSNAELYHCCNDENAVTRRSQMLDRMMIKNGMQPRLLFLSEEEQLVVGNQLTELMLTRLKGWEKVDRLMGGTLTLKDLSLDHQFDAKVIQKLFEQSTPLKRLG
tara:strand:+ start:9534 stop:14033 length:4500 start_codon:yes stop_codon:yes gene_type:complete